MASYQGCHKSRGALAALITQTGLKFKGKDLSLSENQFLLGLGTQKAGICEIKKKTTKAVG